MDNKDILKLLTLVKNGKLSIDKAADSFKQFEFEDLGFAKVDHGREKRRGAPEVIFCQNKTAEQVLKISEAIINNGSTLLATRLDIDKYNEFKGKIKGLKYDETSQTLTFVPKGKSKKKVGRIVLISAGTSDLPVAEEAAITAEILGNKVERIYDVGVAGIHRLLSFQSNIDKAKVIIVVAGMEGALASVVGGLTSKPVIGVPTSVGYGASFGGVSALLSMLNSCASGVTVVNIDNGFGAGYAASQINKIGIK